MLLKCCIQYISKFRKHSSGYRTGKGQYLFQSKRRAIPKNVQTTLQLCSFHMLARLWSKSFKVGLHFNEAPGGSSVCYSLRHFAPAYWAKGLNRKQGFTCLEVDFISTGPKCRTSVTCSANYANVDFRNNQATKFCGCLFCVTQA